MVHRQLSHSQYVVLFFVDINLSFSEPQWLTGQHKSYGMMLKSITEGGDFGEHTGQEQALPT